MKPLRGLWELTWTEIKIFLREPLGRDRNDRRAGDRVPDARPRDHGEEAPIDGADEQPAQRGRSADARVDVDHISAVLSLVTIISIYREGGILKRLRATPLRPWTILTAHVLVKLLLTVLTMAAMVLAGSATSRSARVPVVELYAALLIGTLSILSMGFIIASIVPTARFAQPIGAIIFYPMVGAFGAVRADRNAAARAARCGARRCR